MDKKIVPLAYVPLSGYLRKLGGQKRRGMIDRTKDDNWRING
jgi:hypothetical protein